MHCLLVTWGFGEIMNEENITMLLVEKKLSSFFWEAHFPRQSRHEMEKGTNFLARQ